MNTNRSEILSQSLATLTYNGKSLEIPQDKKLNIYMGIGLWSAKDKLSVNLPVDIMQMLLAAAVIRSQIREVNPEKESKVILLIADSMAVNEGADPYKVADIVSIYKRALVHLLGLLSLIECTEFILSSDLELSDEFQKTRLSIESMDKVTDLRSDKIHWNYACTQTAITQYLHLYRDVGIKVGWILQKSSQKLRDPVINELPWDELKFDRLHQIICRASTIQCLYAKAGLKQKNLEHGIQINEGCPYTAFEKDCCYVIQFENQKELSEMTSLPKKAMATLKKRVAKQWKGVAEVCSTLKELQIVSEKILPDSCIEKSQAVNTVYIMLNHWLNPSEYHKHLNLLSNL